MRGRAVDAIRAGIVKTSSVGRFAANRIPLALVDRRRSRCAPPPGRHSDRCPGRDTAARRSAARSAARCVRPVHRGGTARRNRIRGIEAAEAGDRRESRATCSCWGRPGNTRAAQLAAGAATTHQLVAFFECQSRNGFTASRSPTGWQTRSGGADCSRSGSFAWIDKVAWPACTCSRSAPGSHAEAWPNDSGGAWR